MYEEFLNKLTELKDLALLQGGYITTAQLKEAFPNLDESKNALVKDYFVSNHIGIDEAIDPDSYLSTEEINLLAIYLESLEGIEDMNDAVKLVLKRDCLRGDKDAKNRLMEQYLQTVIDTAKLYSGMGVNMMDLIGEGNVALATAFESIESMESEDDIDPLIMKMIMNSMETLVEEEGNENKIESKSLEIAEKVRAAGKEMAEGLLRKVTVEELSKESGISVNKIREALRISESLYDFIEKEN